MPLLYADNLVSLQKVANFLSKLIYFTKISYKFIYTCTDFHVIVRVNSISFWMSAYLMSECYTQIMYNNTIQRYTGYDKLGFIYVPVVTQ